MSTLETALARLDAQPEPYPPQFRVERGDPSGLRTVFGEQVETWLRDRCDYLMAARRCAEAEARPDMRQVYAEMARGWTHLLRTPLRIRNAARRRVRC